MNKLLKLGILFALSCCPAFAKTLTKIDVLPPAGGYWINSATNTGTLQLSSLCTYDDASTDNCAFVGGATWVADNANAATISGSGLITGAGAPAWNPGTAYAYSKIVSFGGQLYFALNPSTGVTPGTDTSIWSPGPIQFYVVAYNGSVLGRAAVVLANYAVSCINVRPETSAASQIVTGSTVLLSAEDCSAGNNVSGLAIGDYPSYTSSNTGVATVNHIGEVTAVAPGTSVITLQIGSFTATRTVTVYTPTQTLSTWYVRSDGGNLAQCDGTLNVAFAGSSGGHCAVSNPEYCFDDGVGGNGLVHSGDTCSITPPVPGSQPIPAYLGNRYLIAYTTWGANTLWPRGSLIIPSGTPAHPTRIVAACSPNCSTDPDNMVDRVGLVTQGQFATNLLDTQNVVIDGVDIYSGWDCNAGLGAVTTYPCPAGYTSGNNNGTGLYVDSLTSNLLVRHSRIHGMLNALTGLPGPGVVFDQVSTEYNALDGLNFDTPFGYNGNRTDGFSGTNLNARSNGLTEELLKTPSAVTRDSSGNITVTFPAGQEVNYLVGTKIVLAGGDIAGTYPVSAITFNQQTVSVTGGSLSDAAGNGVIWSALINTSSPAAFPAGAFVRCTGMTPNFLNGYWSVHDVSSGSITIQASSIIYGGTLSGAISASGSCSTASTLTASGGTHSALTATTLGTASHVYPAHHGCDQQNGGTCNGDGVGTGNNTIGAWSCVGCSMHRNAQDGWDMVHSVMTISTVDSMLSEGNEGAPAKVGNADRSLIQNSAMIGTGMVNAAFDPNYPPDYNQTLVTFYRANDCSPRNNLAWQTMIVSNNTWDCGFNTIIDDTCNSPIGCTTVPTRKFIDQNNIYLGFNDLANPFYGASHPAIYFAESNGAVPDWAFSNDMANASGTRNPPGTSTGSNWTATTVGVTYQIPDIANVAGEVNALNPDMSLVGGSIAIGAGLHNAYTPVLDITGATRPNPPSIGAYELAGTPTAPTPTFSPVAGTYSSTQSVTISDSLSLATICWNTTGSPATNGAGGCTTGTLYSAPVSVSTSETLYAVAGNVDHLDSAVGSAAYVIQAATPTFAPPDGTSSSTPITSTLSCASPSPTMYYTLDGSTPTTGSTVYTVPLTISVTTQVKAICTSAGLATSAAATANYTVSTSANPSVTVTGSVTAIGTAPII